MDPKSLRSCAFVMVVAGNFSNGLLAGAKGNLWKQLCEETVLFSFRFSAVKKGFDYGYYCNT